MIPADQKYMLEAIKLAKNGWFTSHPNPRVGCVIVKNDQIIARGWHQSAGEEHAEVCALRNAEQQVTGATAYVTLEPCCHHGKTPPCTDALIASGITKVVIAMQDPNPLVAGKGMRLLQQAGIEVQCGVLEETARALNPGFIHRMEHGKPLLRCKMAMSMDGKTAMSSGESQWISSDACRMDVQRLRAQSSAIITGIGTILLDNPSLNVREQLYLSAKQPMRVILDTNLRISSTAKVLQQPENVLILCSNQASDERMYHLQELGAQVLNVQSDDNGLDLPQIVKILAEYHFNEVLIEAGHTLAGAFLQHQLVDELILYQAPKLMGHQAHSLFALPQINTMSQCLELDIKNIRQFGKDIRIIAKPIYH